MALIFSVKQLGLFYIHLLQLLLGCSSTQFTCSNRQCVPISARCNNVVECTDGSDERNCGK